MLDYQLVEAFAAVLEEKGFARAAERLCVTQSAVSQRVKQLEETLGKTLVLRESPPKATPAGEALFRQYRQLLSLEQETLDMMAATGGRAPRIQIAVNVDSLHSWFMEALASVAPGRFLSVEIMTAGHARTIELLRSGAVAGCVASDRDALDSCTVSPLGRLRYALVASGRFAAEHFRGGFTCESAARAPVVNLDRDDDMQRRALYEAFGDSRPDPPAHCFPTTDSYLAAIRAGLGYGLVPLIKVAAEIEAGSLVELDSALRTELPLYWHAWKHRSDAFASFSDDIVAAARAVLK